LFLNSLFFSLFVAGLVVTFIYCYITGISPVSSSWTSRKAILRLTDRNQKGTINELGAGRGALAFPLARRCKTAEVVAYELSPAPWLFMKIWKFLFGPSNLTILRRNFLKANLSSSALVVCYLYPQAMAKLSIKLKKELLSNVTIISNTFELPSWSPSLVEPLEDVMCTQVLVYKVAPVIEIVREISTFIS